MATKIYLQYKEPQHRKWQYASCVVDDDIQTNAEADELLAYGGVHNGFIDELVDYSKFGRLEDWNVLLIESSNEGFSNELKFNDKPKCIVDGERKLKEIRKENKCIKIILLTLYSSEYYRGQAFLLGADYFFSKVDDFEKIALVFGEIA